MSTALAVGAVSAVLRNVLDNGLIDAVPAVGSPIKVTARAPDLIKLDGGMAEPQLNLFVYRVSLNPGWRNAGQPTRDSGGRRISAPPLGLDVHYLLTAYGREDFHAETLLGYGMHLLHERPFLDRAAIRKALQWTPADAAVLPDAFRDPPNAGLADQFEALKISWEPLDLEEMSKLWSALQSHYRPSVGFQVTVVLIEAPSAPGPDPLPVLERKVRAQAGLVPPYPAIDSVAAPDGTATAELGEDITVHGSHLDGNGITIHLRHASASNDIAASDNTDPARLIFRLPSTEPANKPYPAGAWTVSITLTPPGETAARTTNPAALRLAPKWTGHTLTGAKTKRLRITGLAPRLRPGQEVTVALGTAQAPTAALTKATDQVTAEFTDVPPGETVVRVRVDGVDSRFVDFKEKPPVFRTEAQVTVP